MFEGIALSVVHEDKISKKNAANVNMFFIKKFNAKLTDTYNTNVKLRLS
jgi:hypothetical protein